MTQENNPIIPTEEEKQRQAEEIASRIEELKKQKRGYSDTDEDDGYHD